MLLLRAPNHVKVDPYAKKKATNIYRDISDLTDNIHWFHKSQNHKQNFTVSFLRNPELHHEKEIKERKDAY